MTQEEYRKHIQRGNVKNCFMFGHEDFMKQYTLNMIRKTVLVEHSLDVFNHLKFSAQSEDFSFEKLYEAITAAPFMSEKKLVEFHEFSMVKASAADKDKLITLISELCNYSYTVFVIFFHESDFFAGDLKKTPSTDYKTLSQHLEPIVFDWETPERLAAWVAKHFEREGIAADSLVCRFLVDYCGRSMNTLSGEIQKICCYIKVHPEISLNSDLVRLICCPNDEFGEFEIDRCIRERDFSRLLMFISDAEGRKTKPIDLMSSMARTIGNLCAVKLMREEQRSEREIATALKIHEYTVKLANQAAKQYTSEALKHAVQLCLDTDVALKSNPANGYMLLSSLVAKLASL